MINSINPVPLVVAALLFGYSDFVLGQNEKKTDDKKTDIVREIQVPPSARQAKPPEEPPEQYHVKNISAPEPIPALKYRLYPSRGEMKPGNSVPFYYRVVLLLNERTPEQKQEFYDFMELLGQKPFAEYDDPETQKQAQNFQFDSALKQLETAVYREQTFWDWQMNQLEEMEPIAFLLPEAQESREIARILFVRSRLEAAKGNIEEALRLNVVNLKLARDIAEPPTLINDLIGIAISSMSMATLRDMICQTDCPNLYWALATLPDPLISLDEAMEFEGSMPERMFPFLKDPETAVRSADEWARLMREAAGTLGELDSGFGGSEFTRDLRGAGILVRSYPVAKRELIEAGWERDQLEAMPVGQVVAIYQKRVTRTLYDETIKWSYLSYAETQRSARLKEEQNRFNHESQRVREPIPLAYLLLPGVLQVKHAEAQMNSRIKGLMVLEAIRMHAAENEGQLPKSLAEITVVPVPEECPLTGQPYEYKYSEEAGASLIVPFMHPIQFGPRYAWEFHLKSN